MATKPALGADFSGQKCNLTGEFLELVDHGVDCAFEEGDFRVHLLGMYQDLFTQIAHSDGCDNSTDFSQRLLEGQVCLLVSVG